MFRPPFAYYGGKTRLANTIAATLPAHLPDETAVRIEIDQRELVAHEAGPESLTIDGAPRGTTYQGVEHLRIHARAATHAELVEVYLAAPGQSPDGDDPDGYA